MKNKSRKSVKKVTEEPIDSTPLLNKLTSETSDERAWAAAAISHLVQQLESRETLLSNNVIGLLINSIHVNPPEIQIDIVGALRNLLIYGNESEISKEMCRKDLVSSLIQLLPLIAQFCKDVLTQKETPTSVQQLGLGEQVFNVLYTIAEQNTSAYTTLLNTSIISLLVEILIHPSLFPFKFVTTAGSLLVLLVEDSPKSINFFKSNPMYIQSLIDITNGTIQSEFRTVKENKIRVPICCASVLYALIQSNMKNIDTLSIQRDIHGVCVECLEMDVQDDVYEAMKLFSSEDVNSEDVNSCVFCERIEGCLLTVHMAIELLTNLHSVSFECEMGDDRKVSGIDERMIDETIEDQEEEKIEQDDDIQDDNIIQDQSDMESCDEDFKMMQEDTVFEDDEEEQMPLSSLISIIPKLIKFVNYKVLDSTSTKSQTLINYIYAIKSCAFGALSNLIKKSPIESKQSQVCFSDMWTWLYTHAIEMSSTTIPTKQEYVTDAIENIITAMWNILMKSQLSLTESVVLINPTLEQISTFIKVLKNQSASESLRIKCVSILCIIGQCNGAIETNRIIGTALFSTLNNQSTPVEVLSEILNAIYDIYGDEEKDYEEPVFLNESFLLQLKSIVKQLSIRVKNVDKRKFRDIRERADESVLNLYAFISYKENVYNIL